MNRTVPSGEHIPVPRLNPRVGDRIGHDQDHQPPSTEKQEEMTDSTEFMGISDEDDLNSEILDSYLRSGTDLSCPMPVQVLRIRSTPKLHQL